MEQRPLQYGEKERAVMEKFFKSILEQDRAPIVVCDMRSVVVYMNPAALARYKRDLTGKSIKLCHPAAANERIDRVLAWFLASRDNNLVYTFRNEEENKDVYMVALRDGDGTLIGYYEKHEYRNRETAPLYDI
jgi:PAS domain-containing protein